jgi:hypothetical protein
MGITGTKKSGKNLLLVDELLEDKEIDSKIIKTFYSKNSLSPVIFQKENNSYKMHENVRSKLLDISNNFIDFVGINFFIHDIVLTGSLANYNWSKFSDIDMHIIIDMSEFSKIGRNPEIMQSIIKEFFDTKRASWNNNYDIKIKNYEVEIYVQDISEKHIASGTYSILNNKWIVEPQKEKHKIDKKMILQKGEEYASIIDNLVERYKSGDNVMDAINDVKIKLKKFRQSGLESGGEYSYENLTFKLLRRNGYIEKLLNLKKTIRVNQLSIKENQILQ